MRGALSPRPVGGQLIGRNEPVYGAADPELYEGERFGNFNYAIPVPAGKYKVRLYFDEAVFRQTGERVFNVFTDGKTPLTAKCTMRRRS
jgi:beta-galactosidase